MIRQEIIKSIEKATGKKNIRLERSENPEHGDYSTSIALKLKKNPQEIIKKLLSAQAEKSPLFERVEAAGPGFINFYLSEKYILKELAKAQKDLSLTNPAWKGKKVAVEFTDPNPFKVFHIGHLYTNTVGETICRLLEASGAKVKRINYQGDVGLHVAKAVWALKLSYPLERAYATGNSAFETDPVAKKEIEGLNKKIYERSDPAVNKIYDRGRAQSLAAFEKIYKRLGTKFDFYYFESEIGKIGKKIVEEGRKKGVFEKSEGAIVFPGEKYGLHKRVFITSEGLPTYETKELGLAPIKYKGFKYDLSIIVTGSEIIDYFKVLIAALKKIYPKLGQRTMHLAHGMLLLKSGKMSSRKGNIVRTEDLLNQVKQMALQRSKNEEIAEKVALAAVKYSLLRVGLGKDIIFDAVGSLSLEGDTGPYLQYTHARFKSILRQPGVELKKLPASVKMSQLERRLAVALLRFAEAIQDAASSFSPNVLANYLHNTAMLANEFYHSHPVTQEKDNAKKQLRVGLVKAIAATLQKGLSILGIFAPEKM
ncbi:MAG: arginyl-tRNA synthetase [Parcubacteria group bacterium Gr01-1014_30]|nr:MAG: arginyl-tRNA synthetase [Parcubacteria group bacterium Gr01-1014_30]